MSEDYYLYFDDSGIRFPEKQQAQRKDGMDYFALGGLLFKGSDRGVIIEAHKKLCEKWNISYPLHSSDIRGKRGDFAWLNEKPKHDGFFDDFNALLCGVPALGFAAVVDRVGYNKRYEEKYGEKRWWMCKTAFSILVERAAKYADENGGRLKIRFEECGKREDRAILEYFKDLKTSGMPFDTENSAKYAFLKPEDFQRILAGEPERSTKKSPLLQVADLYLYPMAKGGYDKEFPPFKMLMENKKLIDSILPEAKIASCGIKYSCFER
ncbi:MAG: hypothetical protein JWL87_624 [Candidatus Adlerbacteria bacterium]|nr:hypothetical protein [Candidatus Adlerbacteria bacterium]